jgi:hypothetical protein
MTWIYMFGDYRKQFFHLSMKEAQSSTCFMPTRLSRPADMESEEGVRSPCSLHAEFHNFLRPDAPDD